jgi:hypothetical protein
MAESKYMDEIIKALRNTKREGIEFVVNFLAAGDFFTAPASTKYHSAYEGGLADHSWYVYKLFELKNKTLKLGLPEDTIAICGLLHDICKVNFYTQEMRNVKESGNWVQKPFYKVDDVFPAGHGVKSMIILMDFIKLTDFEKLAIMWHMGFTVPKDDWMSMQNAFNKFPGVLALHTADLESAYIIENRKGDEDNGN